MAIEVPKTLTSNIKRNLFRLPSTVKHNRLVYGAPGTGKSNYLQMEIDKYFKNPEQWIRVTFHEQYNYNHFVGTYKPVPIYRESKERLFNNKMELMECKMEPLISYEFVAGPFIEILCRAIKNENENYLLIIEELNRAEAASVFGDIFQLLDRDENGVSQYHITFNEDIMSYLQRQDLKQSQIRIPSNFYLWATMNSSDQGVKPLDTAFRRRWNPEYIPLNKYQNKMENETIYLEFLSTSDKRMPWNEFRKIVNDKLVKLKGVPEDKLLGPFFLKPHELKDNEVFVNKILLYLKEDVLRMRPVDMFTKATFFELVEEYKSGKNIFKDLFTSSI